MTMRIECGMGSNMRRKILILLMGYQFNDGTTSISIAFCLDRSTASATVPKPCRELSRTTKLLSKRNSIVESEDDFPSQVQVALQAVRKACAITTKLQKEMEKVATITKQDASPVTVADFASQAVILEHLHKNFHEDIFLAEETSDGLTDGVIKLIKEACQNCSSKLQDTTQLKDCIDLGRTFFQAKKLEDRPRVWCLDPIDGTKGFLRKGQYCVALGLLEDGIPTIGILACPNLAFRPLYKNSAKNDNKEFSGCIFVACRGQGCYQLPLVENDHPPELLPKSNSRTISDTSKVRFCVGVEQGFADPVGKCKNMAEYLHGELDNEGEIRHRIRMDSQAKYGVVARGEAEFYVRLPKIEHREWIWDVAPGVLVLEEAGGKVTDIAGNTLDFSKGAKLVSTGVLGAKSPQLHEILLQAYRQEP